MDERLLKKYRRDRSKGRTASDAYRSATHAVRAEFEKALRGFSCVLADHHTASGYPRYVAQLDGDTYYIETDHDDSQMENMWGVTIGRQQPASREYPREGVRKVGGRRDICWLICEDTPQGRAKWYSKMGYSSADAYRKGCESVISTMDYAEKLYRGELGEVYVRICRDEAGDEEVDSCSGIPEDDMETYVWEAIS